ncbi:hypothetical protein GMSM_45050 [Geomonas sp. Red276]
MAHKVNNALMLFGGSVVGAGLALLFAPCSGAKSRKRIVRFSKSMTDKGEKMVQGFNDSVSDFTGSMTSMGKKVTSMMHR